MESDQLLIPITKLHQTLQDTLLYFALKDQMNDPEEWNNPNEFMPERFLDTSRASKKLVNFGLGKNTILGHH